MTTTPQYLVRAVGSGGQLDINVLSPDDNVGYAFGTDSDAVFYLRSTTLSADEELTGVIVGTSDHQATAANSLIISNITDDGDIQMLVNDGGNSKEFLFADGSEAILHLGHGMASTSFSDGNITNVGNIALDTISSDAGTTVSVTLGTDAGDDFIVGNNSALVVEGDNDKVGVGTDTPAYPLTVKGANAKIQVLGTANDETVGLYFGRPSSDYAGWFNYHLDTDVIDFATAVGVRMRLNSSSALFLGDDSNGGMTTGLTINQGAADNEAFALKSSDVAHGMTTRAETDTYFSISKYDANGGVMSRAITDTGTVGWLLRAHAPSVDSDRDATATGFFMVDSRKNSGSGDTAPDADSNLVVFTAYGVTKFIFDMEGSGHADVEWVAYADHDDIALINDLENEMLEFDGSPERTKRRHMLEEIGVIGKDSWHIENGRPKAMVNQTKLQMLHHGALMQVGERITALEEENTKMKALVEAIGA